MGETDLVSHVSLCSSSTSMVKAWEVKGVRVSLVGEAVGRSHRKLWVDNLLASHRTTAGTLLEGSLT